jgi:hypothetical protein
MKSHIHDVFPEVLNGAQVPFSIKRLDPPGPLSDLIFPHLAAGSLVRDTQVAASSEDSKRGTLPLPPAPGTSKQEWTVPGEGGPPTFPQQLTQM